MALIFWDTMLFIYSFEDHPEFADRVERIRRRMLERGDLLCTSALAVGEIQVKPAELGDQEMLEKYRKAFLSPVITVIPFDRQAADVYSRIRGDRTISRPDAVHLACAASRNVNLFITNDKTLAAKTVAGIDFITTLQGAPL